MRSPTIKKACLPPAPGSNPVSLTGEAKRSNESLSFLRPKGFEGVVSLLHEILNNAWSVADPEKVLEGIRKDARAAIELSENITPWLDRDAFLEQFEQVKKHRDEALSALKALTDWGREHTSPLDKNSPHELLINAVKVLEKACFEGGAK